MPRRGIAAVAARVAACVVALGLGNVGSAAADAGEVAGHVGKGTLVVQTTLGGDSKIAVGGNVAFEERDPLVRVDVLSLGIPGVDASISALAGTQLFPPGGFTVIYDRADSSYTVWSNAKRNYFASGPSAKPSPSPSPVASAVTTADATSNGLFAIFAFLRDLKNDKTFVVQASLAGHGTVNGHPATGLDLHYQKVTSAGDTTDIHGTLQLADDLDAIPVQIIASVKTKSIPQSNVRLDVTEIHATAPPTGDFAVPAGYARAGSLGDVIGRVLTP